MVAITRIIMAQLHFRDSGNLRLRKLDVLTRSNLSASTSYGRSNKEFA